MTHPAAWPAPLGADHAAGYPATVSDAPALAIWSLLRPIAAAVALAQGAALLVNGIAVAWIVVRDGIDGPAEVASPVGVTLEVVLYVIFGAALLWIARGIARANAAALTPFVLAQVLGLTVSIPLASGDGAAAVVGWAVTFSCLLGIVAWLGLVRQRQG